MESHPLGRFLANARQATKGFYKLINQGAECHEWSSNDCGIKFRTAS
jgi:hypothetical protein